MSELPSGWVHARLDDLVDLNPKQNFDDELTAGFVPMSLAPTNFRDKLRFDERNWGEIKKAYTNFKDGDVIFAKVTPCFENGKAAVVDGLPNGIGAGSSEFFVLRPSSAEIPAKYLLALIKNRDFMREGAANMTGAVGLRRVPKQFVESYVVSVPPAAEQIRIAQKLNELLTQVDTLKPRIDAIPALIKRFHQSVLAAAISGELTNEWRQNSPATKVPYATSKEEIAFDGIESKEKYFNEPSTWQWMRLGAAASLINGDRGKNYPNKSEYVAQGLPFINTGHIEPNGTISIHRMNFITKEKFDSLRGGKIKNGDLVYCLRGATMGKTAIVAPFEAGAIASSLVIIRTNSLLLPKFAYYFLTSPQGKSLIKRFDNGSAQPNLSAGSLSSYPVAIPPLSEQTEIVRRVEQLFAFADQLEAKVTSAKKCIDHLTQSILAKAFRGELVPQDPNDEPASVLLERIKAQRAAAPKAKHGRKTSA